MIKIKQNSGCPIEEYNFSEVKKKDISMIGKILLHTGKNLSKARRW